MTRNVDMTDFLGSFVQDFAMAMKGADSRRPVAVNKRSGEAFHPGIGPHSEADAIRLIVAELERSRPGRFAGRVHLNVPYPNETRQRCDLCVGDAPGFEWAIEVKMLRFLGDNGKANDNILMHILSPYPPHRSALTDCGKLLASGLAHHEAILIYGFDHDKWTLDPAIEAFEKLAEARVRIGPRCVAMFSDLVHPVHSRGRVFGWEIGLTERVVSR